MKKALLIGINYKGTSSELRGCINDVKNMTKFLLKNGYNKEDITFLTDKTAKKPTKKNIINAIMKLINTEAESLFLHYSGHGSWVKDINGDEEDGRDECLVPLDYHKNGMIIDDQLRGLLSFMNPKSKMTIILDCCHSGSGFDLKYTLHNKVSYKNIKNRLCRNKTDKWYLKDCKQYNDSKAEVIMISGCQDKQTSADAYEEKIFQGALTYCYLKYASKNLSWVNMIDKINKLLKLRGYTQISLLTCGKPFDINKTMEV